MAAGRNRNRVIASIGSDTEVDEMPFAFLRQVGDMALDGIVFRVLTKVFVDLIVSFG